MEGQRNRNSGPNFNDQDTYIAMVQALAQLFERLDKEDGLSDEDDICKYFNQVEINNGSDQELIGSVQNSQSPQLEHRSRFITGDNFNTSPRPWFGPVVSDETQEKERSLCATQPTKIGNEKAHQPSTVLRKSINQSAQPWSAEVQEVGVFSSVEPSTTNMPNCSSNTCSVKRPNDILESQLSEKRHIENGTSAFVYKTQPFENIVGVFKAPTELENTNAPMSTRHNPTSMKLTENSIPLEYEMFGDETVVTYSISPNENGSDNTLTPSILNRAKNGVYSKDSRRYVTLAHSNNQLDGGVCSVGVDLTADQLQGLYQADKKCEKLDKNMLGMQIDHLAKYTSYSKPNNYSSTDKHLAPVQEYTGNKVVCDSGSDDSLSWKDCLSALESDDNDDGCNLFPTVTKIDDQDSTQLIQNKNKHSNRHNSLARPYLDVSRQWSWYPYKENETPGKTTSPRRKKILTPCSKHICKYDNSTEVNDPFQYGDCEKCNDYVYNLKLITTSSAPSDLSSKAFLRQLMKSTNDTFQDDVSPYRFGVNRVADTSNLTDSILYEKDKFSTTVDMSGDDITNINKVTNDCKQEPIKQKSVHCNKKSDVREMSQRYRDIANVVVWNVLLNSVARIAVSVIINRAVKSMLTSEIMLEKTKTFNDSDLKSDKKKQNEDEPEEVQSFSCISDSVGSHTLDMKSNDKIFEQISFTESYSTHESNTLPSIKQTIGIVPTDTDISVQSLSSTSTLNDNSGLSLSDMTFESFKYMKGKLSAVRHTVQNIGLTDDSCSSLVYPDDSNHLYSCELSSKRINFNDADKMSKLGPSCSPLEFVQHLELYTEPGTQGCGCGNKITSTCDCCNRYICKLEEKLHHDDKIKPGRDEYLSTGIQLIVEPDVTPPYNSEMSINMPACADKTNINQSSCQSDSENVPLVSEEASSSACNEEESNSPLGEVQPASIKIYVGEKCPTFRSPPKQVAVIENSETPTKERIAFVERMAAEVPCYNDDPKLENKNQQVLINKPNYDDDFRETKIEKQHLSKTNINSPSVPPTREQIDEVQHKGTESPGSFTIFQAFFDALYASPDEESEFTETITTEEFSTSCDQDVETVGHMNNEKLNDVDVDSDVYLYEEKEITCVANSSDSKDKVVVQKEIEITQEIRNDNQIASISSSTSSISNESCVTVQVEKKKRRFGCFKGLFTKKNKPNESKKNLNNENEGVGHALVAENDLMHSDIEKKEAEATENILVTDDKKNKSPEQETRFVKNGIDIEKQKHTKKTSLSDLEHVEHSAEVSVQTGGAVSKFDRHVSHATTSKNDNARGTTKSSPNKRLFSFKDVKRSQNNKTKSSRHRRT